MHSAVEEGPNKRKLADPHPVSKKRRRRRCTCKNCKCLRKYCECFEAGKDCDPELCTCVGCKNTPGAELDPEAERERLEKRATHNNASKSQEGCKCKNGGKRKCLVFYCRCFREGKACTSKCRCKGNCGNDVGGEDAKAKAQTEQDNRKAEKKAKDTAKYREWTLFKNSKPDESSGSFAPPSHDTASLPSLPGTTQDCDTPLTQERPGPRRVLPILPILPREEFTMTASQGCVAQCDLLAALDPSDDAFHHVWLSNPFHTLDPCDEQGYHTPVAPDDSTSNLRAVDDEFVSQFF